MSLKLGASTSKQTSTTNSQSATTPIVPEWASFLTQGVAGKVNNLLGADPYSLVSPASPLQTLAAQSSARLNTTGAAPQIGAQSVGGGASVLDNLSSYMNPYTKNVVDAALTDYDFGAGQTRAQQDLDLARSGAFSGSGSAITRAMTEDALTRGRATTSSTLRSQAFDAAAALSNQDADRRQQAAIQNAQLGRDQATQNANLSFASDANQRANIGSQFDIGGTLRGIDEEGRQAPFTSAQQIVAMLNGLPISLFTGQQTDGTQTTDSTGKGSSVSAGVTIPIPGLKA